MQETATNSTILQLKLVSGRHFVLRHGQLSTLICSVGVPIFQEHARMRSRDIKDILKQDNMG